jgi:hypothetical protein
MNTTHYLRSRILFLVLVLAVPEANASWLSKVVKKAGGEVGKVACDAATSAGRVLTVPTETLRRAVNGESTESILAPTKAATSALGKTVKSATTLAVLPQKEIYAEVQELAKKAGPGAGFVVDLGTIANRYSVDLVESAGNATGDVLQGNNPLQVLAGPLAAAIRNAHARHNSSARSIPADVKRGLAGKFPPGVLERARYTTGNIEITLPTALGRGQRFMDGSDYAVVVDDIIVFNVTPPSYDVSPGWWAHEITHVEQYTRWGVDNFAWRYLENLGRSVEGEANNNSTRFTGQGITAAIRQSNVALPDKPRPTTAYSSASTSDDDDTNSGASPNIEAPRQIYTTVCVFLNDPYGAYVAYAVTPDARIYAVDRMNGANVQIGWAIPPSQQWRSVGAQWVYYSNNAQYGVDGYGRIFTMRYYPNGYPAGPTQVGFAQRL